MLPQTSIPKLRGKMEYAPPLTGLAVARLGVADSAAAGEGKQEPTQGATHTSWEAQLALSHCQDKERGIFIGRMEENSRPCTSHYRAGNHEYEKQGP